MMQKVVLLAFATALLLCHSADGSPPAFKPGTPVNKFCTTADSKRLCTVMVGGAQNLHDATAHAIRATLTVAKKIQSLSDDAIIPAVADLPAVSKDSVLQTCKESFANAVDDLNLSLQALDNNDKGTVLTRLSAALPSDCGDALKEFGEDFPLQTVVKLYQRYLDSTLAVVTQE